jgi:hypothetical protein
VRKLTPFPLAHAGRRDPCVRGDLRSRSVALLESTAGRNERRRLRLGDLTPFQSGLTGRRRKRKSVLAIRSLTCVENRGSALGDRGLCGVIGRQLARGAAPISARRRTRPVCRDFVCVPSLTRRSIPFAGAASARSAVTSVRLTLTNPHKLGPRQDYRGRDIGCGTADRAGDRFNSIRCGDGVLRLRATSSGRVGRHGYDARPSCLFVGRAQAQNMIVNVRPSVNRQAHFVRLIELAAERDGVSPDAEIRAGFRHGATCSSSRHLLLRSARNAQEVKGNRS